MKHDRFAITSVRMHLILASASAVLLGLAFPYAGWWSAAHVALVPLSLLGLRSIRVKRLVGVSYGVGVAWWLWMLPWLWQVTGGGYVVLCLYLGMYWPAYVVGLRAMDRLWKGKGYCLKVPLVWVSLEFLRGYIVAGGFGWFTLSAVMANHDPAQRAGLLVQSADLFGHWTVSLIVAMTSGMVVDLLLGSWKRSSAKWYRLSPGMVSYIFWMMVILGAAGYGSYRIQTTPQQTPVLNVAVIQTNVSQNNKDFPTAKMMSDNWNRLLTLSRQAAEQGGPDVLVWPETMSPAALNDEATAYYREAPTAQRGYERFVSQIRGFAENHDVYLLVGAHAMFDWKVVRGRDGKEYVLPSRRFNSVYLVSPDVSKPLTRYDKIHRVPFGEYIPWVSRFAWLKRLFMKYLSPYSMDYTLSAGRTRTVFEVVKGGSVYRLATPICYEDTVARGVKPMVYNKAGRKRADVLVNVTNDGWYTGLQGLEHLQHATLRCIENRVPMARSVNTGVSGFIDSVGRVGPVVHDSHGRAQDVEGWQVHSMRLDDRVTLFGRWGQLPMACLSGLTFVFVLIGLLRSGKRL